MTDRTRKPGTSPAYEGGFGPTIDHDPNETRPAKRGWSLTTTVGLGLAAIIGIGAVVSQAAGWGQGGWNSNGGFGSIASRFAEARLVRMLDEVDASKAQQDKIWAIFDRARSDIRETRADFRDSRGEFAAILGGPTIDAAAIEKLRLARVEAIDQASKTVSMALIEAAEILTSTQRAELAQQMKDWGGRWPR